MKSIYLLLTSSGTLLAGAIRRATGDPYTHVSLCFEEDLETWVSFARRFSRLPLPAGLVVERLKAGYYGIHPEIPCALLEIKVSGEAYRWARKEAQRMLSRAGDFRYSLWGLWLCRKNIVHNRPFYYFCSQFAGELLSRSGAVRLPKHPSLMRPVDFDLMPECSCLFRGSLRELLRRKGDRGRPYAGPGGVAGSHAA